MNHRYVSTYCQHDWHSDCRLTCKVCGADCLCQCHRFSEVGDCPHERVTTYRSYPPRSVCKECGVQVKRVWVEAAPTPCSREETGSPRKDM